MPMTVVVVCSSLLCCVIKPRWAGVVGGASILFSFLYSAVHVQSALDFLSKKKVCRRVSL